MKQAFKSHSVQHGMDNTVWTSAHLPLCQHETGRSGLWGTHSARSAAQPAGGRECNFLWGVAAEVNAPGPATEPDLMAHVDALNLPLFLEPQVGSFTQVEGATKVGWGGHCSD